MTPEAAAAIHTAAFVTSRAWDASEISALVAAPHTHLTSTGPDGFAIWRAIAGEAELLTIAVHPTAQGRGVGRRLMHAWTTAATPLAQSAFLEVAADNAAACALYARFGFAHVARRTGYYARGDGRVDALVMRAALPLTIPDPAAPNASACP
ncbi:GNAT family N-acetyltransferase [uncultured Tateyamaria sp.]|uniref:GNAT family N-acetyltransferase n=1 Tax=uncultured Tateyamaria sp. TaxID=455651 RepID=UPI002628509E|nr:GNAT family N-acetyltransferase [uncultured Tateyamaria sp.]